MAEYHLYGGLSRASSWDSASPDQKLQHFEALMVHHKQLKIWAENCPENFENRAALVGAEIARIEGRALDAEHLYEQAIRSAQANGFVHNEALANELAARFYAARGFEKIAYAYLRDARYGYLRWGATGKVRQLDELYPRLREEKPLAGPTSTMATPVEYLDLATVIKVSQAVSGETVLEKLIDTLMRTAIEHAGAERGLLILQRGNEQRIEAEATISGESVIVRLKEAAVSGVPESIIHFVTRTREHVILDDAVNSSFSADPYIHQYHARSILCLPLINQAKLIGVLYLENSLTPHVFTHTRIIVLKLLASQAAISLDWKEAQQALQMTQGELARVSRLTTMGELAASIAHEVNQPLTAVNNNSNACLRLLANQNLQPDVLRRALEEIVADSTRASAVMARIRALIKKTPAEKTKLDLNEVIQEVLSLTGRELFENRILLEPQLTDTLPPVLADRVQLQQVLLNLIMNGVEAMNAVTNRPHLLWVQSRVDESGDVLVAVRDSGTGLGIEADRVFTPFFTTKANGMGMGLPISRSLIEGHGGRLWATPNFPHGAVFSFTLPVATGSTS
jgi:signal transduction histidine kinase